MFAKFYDQTPHPKFSHGQIRHKGFFKLKMYVTDIIIVFKNDNLRINNSRELLELINFRF